VKLRSTTCIVGLVEDGVVLIGGDSAATYDHSLGQRIISTKKVFALDEELLIGCCGSIRALQLLQYGFDRPKHHPGTSDDEYIVTSFMDAVRERYTTGGHVPTWSDGPEQFDGAFMIGYRARLYVIEADYGVICTAEPYAAIGCGEDLALGCLAGTLGVRMAPRKRVTRALEVAEQFSGGVKRPFHIVQTQRKA
jgi:ATP-dependent protease HslVU (ClpYQ) peptidase subunit